MQPTVAEEKQKKVITYFIENPTSTMEMIAAATNISKSSCQRYLTMPEYSNILIPSTRNTIEEQLRANKLLGNQKGGRNTFATHTVQKDESGKFVGTKKDTEEVDKEAKKRDDIKRIVRYFSQHPYDTLDTMVEIYYKVYTRDYIYACLNDPRVDELFGKLIAKAVRQQLADNRYSIMKKFEDNWGQELFVAAGLTEREIQILNLRFSNNVITSVEAVALQLQVTHQMISKIENQALGKLEEYQKQKGDVK